jgi:DNA-directed RNA polymerase specialized sigma24 family protein
MGKRDPDREQHVALARTKARKAGGNVQASARNAGIDYDRAMNTQRKKDRMTKRLDDLLTEPFQDTFLHALADLEHAQVRIEQMLAKLPDRERQVMRAALQGVPYTDLAKTMQISPTRVRQLYLTAVKRLGGDRFTCRSDKWRYTLEKSSARSLRF